MFLSDQIWVIGGWINRDKYELQATRLVPKGDNCRRSLRLDSLRKYSTVFWLPGELRLNSFTWISHPCWHPCLFCMLKDRLLQSSRLSWYNGQHEFIYPLALTSNATLYTLAWSVSWCRCPWHFAVSVPPKTRSLYGERRASWRKGCILRACASTAI